MYLITTDDYEALSAAAAENVAAAISANPTAVLLLATGESPMGLYREIAARRARGELETSGLRIIQLDEYLGVRPDDRRSLYRWLSEAVLQPWGIPDNQAVRLPGDAPDPQDACRRFEEQVRALGGIDTCVLGVGLNGHLGFNEPPSSPADRTRIVTLTEASIGSNAAYWGGRDQVPPQALTAGMNLLLAARSTLLVASGERKRDILHRAVTGPLTPDVPASFLQGAANVTVIADAAAWPGPPVG